MRLEVRRVQCDLLVTCSQVALALVALVVAVAEAGYHHYGGYGGKWPISE